MGEMSAEGPSREQNTSVRGLLHRPGYPGNGFNDRVAAVNSRRIVPSSPKRNGTSRGPRPACCRSCRGRPQGLYAWRDAPTDRCPLSLASADMARLLSSNTSSQSGSSSQSKACSTTSASSGVIAVAVDAARPGNSPKPLPRQARYPPHGLCGGDLSIRHATRPHHRTMLTDRSLRFNLCSSMRLVGPPTLLLERSDSDRSLAVHRLFISSVEASPHGRSPAFA